MKKFLLHLADLPTPQFPERFADYISRYTHPERHADRSIDPKVRRTGWGVVVRERTRRFEAGLAY
jgi:hypothetical protein